MASKKERVFAGFFAGLFLFTSSALTIAVIYQVVQDGKKPKTADNSEITKALEKAKETKVDSNKLTGTAMQNFTPTTTPQDKLTYIDTTVGDGAEVKAGDTVTANYVGALMSTGTIFDASADHGGPQTFPLSGVIAGWSQGIPGMKVGGTRRLLIPASLGYGTQGSGSAIPPNSDLVFDVTITKVGN